MSEPTDALAEAAKRLLGDVELPPDTTSKNERAERLMGSRHEGDGPAPVPFDMPCELGYRCPVCLVEEVGAEDEALQWSEYAGFLWCERCDRDYPSPLCVPMTAAPEEKAWRHAIGAEAAVRIYLDTVEQAIERAKR